MSSGVDGVQLAVITNRLQGVVRKMTNTLFRTARSGVINSARDFSCCIVTRDDELLATAESLPIHVMSGPDLMSRAMKELHHDLRAGDAFLHNSPYHGNSHAGDHSLLVPVIDQLGEHRFTVLVKAHIADIGNSAPTTLMASARDVYEEGALIFPCVRVQRGYEDVADVVRMCRARIRVPEQWWGDHLGLLGAARIGERELLKLGQELGWGALHDYTDRWLDYSEHRMRAAIRALPSGRVTASSAHDPAPGAPDGVPVTVTVDVDAEREVVGIDLRENVDCLPCGLNLTEATARTAAMVGVFNSIGAGVPANAGSFRRLEIALRENCVAGIPRHPASCSVATTSIADRVANAVQRALAGLGDGVGMAECGFIPAAAAIVSGKDPRHDDAPFVNMIILGENGGAGTPTSDAWLTIGHVGNGGLVFRDSTELVELLQPLVVWSDRIVADTEGAGRFRGAPAGLVEFGPTETAVEVMWASDGCVVPPSGVRGGHDGAVGSQHRRGPAGEEEPLPSSGRIVLAPGETLVSYCAGGGGYGPPHEREPSLVQRDVAEGWVSRARAEAVYRVVLDASGAVDAEATARVREHAGAAL